MVEGTAFKLVIGFAMIVIAMLLWIPLNEVVGQVGGIFNAMTTGNATYDAEMIERNNIGAAIFSAVPIFLILAYGIWVLRSAVVESRGGSI